MPPSIFTQIINGEQPAYKIFEDEYSCAFLSRDVIQLGHTLIVPKIEVDYFVEVPEPFYSVVFQNAKIIAKAIHRATRCRRVGMVIAGWDVPHFHLHLIPMFEYDDLNPSKARLRSPEEMKTIQAEILKTLEELKAE